MAPFYCALGMAAAILAWLAPVPAYSQQSQPVSPTNETHSEIVDRVNGGRVGIISGGIGGTYIRIATDLASVLDDGDELRILPIMGKGSVQNITDILYLRGIDVGVVQSDVLNYMKRQPVYRNVQDRINYITKLYNEEFHVIGGSDIEEMKDLAGKKVNFGVEGSGTFMTATTVFKTLGIDVKPVHHDQALALEKIKNGEIAATVYVAGKPAKAVADLKKDSGYRLVPVPYTPELQQTYLPASFSAKDYPIVRKDEPVDTIAVGAVMAVFNWEPGSARYKRIVRFIDAFFSNFEKFRQPPRHSKWQEVNLAAELPGWTRFEPAAEWLEENPVPGSSMVRKEFNRFVASNGEGVGMAKFSDAQREALFQEFMEWRQSRK